MRLDRVLALLISMAMIRIRKSMYLPCRLEGRRTDAGIG